MTLTIDQCMLRLPMELVDIIETYVMDTKTKMSLLLSKYGSIDQIISRYKFTRAQALVIFNSNIDKIFVKNYYRPHILDLIPRTPKYIIYQINRIVRVGADIHPIVHDVFPREKPNQSREMLLNSISNSIKQYHHAVSFNKRFDAFLRKTAYNLVSSILLYQQTLSHKQAEKQRVLREFKEAEKAVKLSNKRVAKEAEKAVKILAKRTSKHLLKLVD